jgi:hypothetical protein
MHAWPHWRKFGKSTIVRGAVLDQDFKAFIQSVNDNGVHFLVIGGYAVALHGYPRCTKDIDHIPMSLTKCQGRLHFD